MSNKFVRERPRGTFVDSNPASAWLDRELAACEFKDEQLGKRFRSLLARLATNPGESLPLARQDWANTKGAYWFLDSGRVGEVEILGGHFNATRDRVAARDGTILVLHDTTKYFFTREDIDAVGITRKRGRRQASKRETALLHRLRDFDAFKSRRDNGRLAIESDGGQIPVSRKVQRNECVKEENHPHSCPRRRKGKRPMVGRFSPIHRAARRADEVRAHR